MARLRNGPEMPLKAAMNGLKDDETPSEESRMPARKFMPHVEHDEEGAAPTTRKLCIETDSATEDGAKDDEGVAGVVKSATRTVSKEGSVMLGSMPQGDERRVI